MWIPVERLLVRVRQVRSRADEVLAVRRRLRTARAEVPGADERELAHEIRALKQELSAMLATVSSCGTCARGRRPPRGAFAGGDCCSGVTADLFSDDEVAALAFAGTRPRDLRPPRTEHAGCAFRGATGCTLSAVDRPERCVHYTCNILRRELRASDQMAAIDAVRDELHQRMHRFVELRAARLDDELLAPIEEALIHARDASERS